MSSPLAFPDKTWIRKVLIKFHHSASHDRRTVTLARQIGDLISRFCTKDEINCLDIGCGDMVISHMISENVANSRWVGIDLYELPEDKRIDPQWASYRQFDGQQIPFEDQSFDCAVICDVLHHDWDHIEILLREACRVAKIVIVKDHFEYGMFSRHLLRAMDFVGNWAYGVSIPHRYLDEDLFSKYLEATGIREIHRQNVNGLYVGLLEKLLIKPKYQFISILHAEFE